MSGQLKLLPDGGFEIDDTPPFQIPLIEDPYSDSLTEDDDDSD